MITRLITVAIACFIGSVAGMQNYLNTLPRGYQVSPADRERAMWISVQTGGGSALLAVISLATVGLVAKEGSDRQSALRYAKQQLERTDISLDELAAWQEVAKALQPTNHRSKILNFPRR